MRDSNVKTLLFLSIVVMTTLPLVAAFYFLDHALQTSLDLGFNPQVVRLLENDTSNLKTLKDLDPANEARYREQFNEAAELKHIYANPELIKNNLQRSLTIYFGIGLVAAVGLSIAVVALVNRSIARTYANTYGELIRQRERVRYLEEISSWQELAKMLAHEIKNPLTPIEVLVTSLSKAYLAKPQSEFQAQLHQTQAMINEELAHLKHTVNKFSEFARLPTVQLVEEDLSALLRQHLKAIAATFENADIRLEENSNAGHYRAKVDATLLRQVLTNVIKNGTEANPARIVQFAVSLAEEEVGLRISIANDGELVPAALAGRIFDPYVSGKSGKENMGLGLAIVKKIVIEHGGEVTYAPVGGRPCFAITLPKLHP